MIQCLECGCEIVITKLYKTKKFCSKYCREKYWVKLHPERDKELKKRWRMKKPVLCKNCSKEVPHERRANGVQFCSEDCKKIKSIQRAKFYREKIGKLFSDYKQKIGCEICKYNKNPACLDFHHVSPEKKERRIDAGLWYFNSFLFKEERKKCILICKNCHYELHNPIDK